MAIVWVTIVRAATRRFVLIFRMSMNEQTEVMLAPSESGGKKTRKISDVMGVCGRGTCRRLPAPR